MKARNHQPSKAIARWFFDAQAENSMYNECKHDQRGKKMKQFYIKQKAISLTDQYKIYDVNQTLLYEVKSKLFSITNKMDFIRVSDGSVIYHFQKQLFRLLATYHMMDGNMQELATVKKQFSVFSKKVHVETPGETYEIEGDFIGHQFSVMRNASVVASLKKKWISWGDAYEITIHDDATSEFMLGLVILLDSIFHEESKRRH